MRRLIFSVFLIFTVVFLSAGLALADKQLTVRQLESVTILPYTGGEFSPGQVCQVGNTNSPAWAIPDFIMPPEVYKLVFDPKLGCGACAVGIIIETIHIVIQTEEACDIDMAVDVEEVSYLPADPNCPRPGDEWCFSGDFQVSIPDAGIWDIGLPLTCDCLTDERLYCLGIYFNAVTSASGTVPDLLTDAAPTLCTNWNNYGAGWEDMVVTYQGWPGNLIIYADTDCCSPPMPVKDSTWGHIKSLYGD